MLQADIPNTFVGVAMDKGYFLSNLKVPNLLQHARENRGSIKTILPC